MCLRLFKSQLFCLFFLQHSMQITCTDSKHSNVKKSMHQYNTEFLRMTLHYSSHFMPHFIFLYKCTFVFPIPQMSNSSLLCFVFLTDTLENWIVHINGTLFGDQPLIQIVSIQFAFLSKYKKTRTLSAIQQILLLPASFSSPAALTDLSPAQLKLAHLYPQIYTTSTDIFRVSNSIFINSTGKM